MHKIANDEFRVTLTLRLYPHQKCIIPGTMCDCRKGKNAIPLDCDGIHLTTGCIKGGNPIHNHDRVKDQTAKILSYCGLSTTIGGRFFCARTRVRIFFADAIFLFADASARARFWNAK